jgi:hypothetical protein
MEGEQRGKCNTGKEKKKQRKELEKEEKEERNG